MVDKWLFDKDLTYQEVAEACRETFGLRVSRSSVGRYYEREAESKVRRKNSKFKVREGGQGRKFGTAEENYQECLKWMTSWAVAELKWPVADEQDISMVLRFMRLLMAARSERIDAKSVAVQRKKFQLWAAKDCLKYWRKDHELYHSPTPSQGFEDTPALTPVLSPRRGGNECRSGCKHRREREQEDRRRAARHERETWYLGV
jgi:hypothetical protein